MKSSYVRYISISLFASSIVMLQAVYAVAQPTSEVLQRAGNEQVAEIMKTFAPRGVQSDGSEPTPPDKVLDSFQLIDGMDIDLVASEPQISQPLFLSWDSRGRMWVVQYRQYQYPAGLKVVRYDHHLRAVFDQVPEAPPNHVKGKDRISVLEDTDGDGLYDKQKDVITGLNIATSLAVGHGGIWVLNPPYLLFYPDADEDDVPDSAPEVRLSGFGLQDTHSVANSLLWGPDGWLYGANGSTTGGTVSSDVTPGVTFQGQCIWRYHPDSRDFEIYAEGGGNTFSLEIDSKGRVFSGHNGGNTRGWYYPQGSYSAKNWGKHGPLTNPFAFGYFNSMRLQGDARRFAQAFLIYEGGLFPYAEFDGNIIAPNAMQNLVWHSLKIIDGSTYRTVDQDNLAESRDRWFRPVYSGVGPDGAVYIADWYDTRLSHVSPTDDWHKESGRVYRIRPSESAPRYSAGDLAKATDDELISLFEDKNKWIRRRSVLELTWREQLQPGTTDRLIKLVDAGSLEALWVIGNRDALSEELATRWLNHKTPDIRRWVIRLLGDRHQGHPGLVALAHDESNIQVRSQLAATAKRLDAKTGLGIASGLLSFAQDLADPHMPLMIWWAIEAHANNWDAIKEWLGEASLQEQKLFLQFVSGRLMQRYASEATRESLTRCDELIGLATTDACKEQFIQGLNKAFQGRRLPELSSRLQEELAGYRMSRGNAGLILAIEQGDDASCVAGLRALKNASTDLALKIEIVSAFGKTKYAASSEHLLKLATSGSIDPALQRVAIQSLAIYEGMPIAQKIAQAFDNRISAEHDLRNAACRLLASRKEWALVLLNEINSWRLRKSDIPPDVIQRLRIYQEADVVAALEQAFGKPADVSSPEKVAEIRRLTELLEKGRGDAEQGQRHFTKNCGTCHQLKGSGTAVGPPLDNYDRKNLKFWLPAVIAPSIEIREGYQTYAALTLDGQVITGMIAKQDLNSIQFRTADGREVSVQREEIDEFRAVATSLMPEDLLGKLTDQEILDLFTYLQE